MNTEKSRAVSIYSNRNFKFLGFALGRNKSGAYIRIHPKMREKAKQKLKRLTSRSQGRKLDTALNNIKVFMQGWLGYYGIACIKGTIDDWNGWLRRRIRMYIWKQWKKPRTKVANLKKLGMPDWQAYRNGNTRKGYWAVAGSGIPKHTSLCTLYTLTDMVLLAFFRLVSLVRSLSSTVTEKQHQHIKDDLIV